MLRFNFFLSFVLSTLVSLQAQDVPHAVIEEQLSEAEQEFDEARKMFNPWYAGPLLTGSAHVLDAGLFNIQAYLFVTDNYARYDGKRKTQSISDIVEVNPQFIFQAGIVNRVDGVLVMQGIYNNQKGTQGGGFGDISLNVNLRLLKETPYIPAMKIGIKESFPLGNYKNLSSTKGGLDSSGSGSYQTTFIMNFSKVIWWISLHPMSTRLSINYTIPSKVSVRNFNTYGGGFGTRGKVDPGNLLSLSFGYEYSFTENWVFAVDVAYEYTNETKFSGNPGVDRTGAPASVGGGSSDQLSLAPAIEYNPSPRLGFLGGVWFTVYGRNSSAFISGIVSVTYLWGV